VPTTKVGQARMRLHALARRLKAGEDVASEYRQACMKWRDAYGKGRLLLDVPSLDSGGYAREFADAPSIAIANALRAAGAVALADELDPAKTGGVDPGLTDEAFAIATGMPPTSTRGELLHAKRSAEAPRGSWPWVFHHPDGRTEIFDGPVARLREVSPQPARRLGCPKKVKPRRPAGRPQMLSDEKILTSIASKPGMSERERADELKITARWLRERCRALGVPKDLGPGARQQRARQVLKQRAALHQPS
jgi:hypothetical protein